MAGTDTMVMVPCSLSSMAVRKNREVKRVDLVQGWAQFFQSAFQHGGTAWTNQLPDRGLPD
jgi:hypothetical protein